VPCAEHPKDSTAVLWPSRRVAVAGRTAVGMAQWIHVPLQHPRHAARFSTVGGVRVQRKHLHFQVSAVHADLLHVFASRHNHAAHSDARDVSGFANHRPVRAGGCGR